MAQITAAIVKELRERTGAVKRACPRLQRKPVV